MASDAYELQHCASSKLSLLHCCQQERLRAELRKAQQEPGDGDCAEQRTPDAAAAAAAASNQVSIGLLAECKRLAAQHIA